MVEVQKPNSPVRPAAAQGIAPMPVKHWTFAGLLLTYRCNARCASCYVCSAPESAGDMSVEHALALWRGLQQASPHGCRIHIGGGEPFGRWEALIELARRAKAERLGPLEAVETNAFWAGNVHIVRDRLSALSSAGMGRLVISCDPYHQQFVPIARVRMLAAAAAELLGRQRVRVRWRDWAEQGLDTDGLPPDRRRRLFADYARQGRDRLTGRAAQQIARDLDLSSAPAFADNPCNQSLLRSRHVHVDGAGDLCPGACAGIVLGRARKAEDVGEIWRRLKDGFADMEVIRPLARSGPAGLLQVAQAYGYLEDPRGYADKCHLCWSVRKWLFQKGHFRERLGPVNVYGT